MARVTGIGGVFVRSPDPGALAAWYARHLGLPTQRYGGATFHWSADGAGSCTWAPFPEDTRYFGHVGQQMMINFRVDDVDGMVARLRADGIEVEGPVADEGFGWFAWCADPDGNRVELWEPAAGL